MPISDRDKRTLRIGGIVAGVLIVGLVLFNVLSGGGGTETALPPTAARSATPTVTPTVAPTTTPTPVAVFTGRDPFSTPPQFLVVTSGTGSSSSGGSTTSSSSSGSGSSSSTSTPISSTPTQPGGGSSANLGGHTVVLLDTFRVSGTDRAQVEIDGVVYNVAIGERFGPGNRFELRSVSGNCGTFVFGDESFTLCITPSK